MIKYLDVHLRWEVHITKTVFKMKSILRHYYVGTTKNYSKTVIENPVQ